MQWIEIRVEADGEAAEAVSALFNLENSSPDGQGGAVTEVMGFDPVGEEHHPTVAVITYLLADAPDSPERQRRIEEGIWYLGRIHPLGQPQIRRIADEDWSNTWKANYHPLSIGRSFLIIPAWKQDEVMLPEDRQAIVLDPGMAFGTGLHPSTQLCLMAIEDTIHPGERVLDAGCGSGILSIAAARLGASTIDAFDIDPIAVTATLSNASLNHLSVPISARVCSGPDGSALWQLDGGASARWDEILANILPHVILSLLAQGLAGFLAPEGRMLLAGIIEAREPEVLTGLAAHGLRVLGRYHQADWIALVAGWSAPDRPE